MAEEKQISIAERYDQLSGGRKDYITRAEDAAKATIPSAFVEDSFTAASMLNRNYSQGFMADLVKNLVGKLALTILPPSQPFYRLAASPEALEAITGTNEDARYEIEQILGQKEEGILRNINKTNFRGSLYPALRQAVIAGECKVEHVEDRYKVIKLKNYVQKRDHLGNIVEFIIKEVKTYQTLDPEFQSKVEEDKKDEDIDLYTKVEMIDGSYVMTQEMLGEPLGTEIKFKKFTDRFIDVTWDLIDGEDYARGFVEDYSGTIYAYEKLLKVTIEGIAEGVKIVKLVNPNGMTKYEDFNDAKHGDAIIGHESDITTIQSNKAQDLMVAKSLLDEMKAELTKAFLVLTPRQSERTPLGETEMIANQLESALGGIYTSISDKIQRPLVEQAMETLNIDGGDDIDVIITTGVQALGRNVELMKIRGTLGELGNFANIVGQEPIVKSVNVDAVISAIIANSGVASKNFIYSKAQKAEAERAAKEDMLAGQVAAGGMPQLGKNAADAAMQGVQQ